MIALMYEKPWWGVFIYKHLRNRISGANNLQLPLNAPYMLNLDSEEEGEICIGCAGGVDILEKFK